MFLLLLFVVGCRTGQHLLFSKVLKLENQKKSRTNGQKKQEFEMWRYTEVNSKFRVHFGIHPFNAYSF